MNSFAQVTQSTAMQDIEKFRTAFQLDLVAVRSLTQSCDHLVLHQQLGVSKERILRVTGTTALLRLVISQTCSCAARPSFPHLESMCATIKEHVASKQKDLSREITPGI